MVRVCLPPPPALLWSAGPLKNQIDAMGDKKKSVAAGLGLGAASLLAAQSAEAAQQVADLAAGDNRFGTLALLALPALGWVGFNILGEWLSACCCGCTLQAAIDDMQQTRSSQHAWAVDACMLCSTHVLAAYSACSTRWQHALLQHCWYILHAGSCNLASAVCDMWWPCNSPGLPPHVHPPPSCRPAEEPD